MRYVLKFKHHTMNGDVTCTCKTFDEIASLGIVVNASPYTHDLRFYSSHRGELKSIDEYFTVLEKLGGSEE